MIEAETSKVDYFEVFEDNWKTVDLFVRLQTQWNLIEGVFIGLNYQSVRFLFKLYAVEDERSVFDELQSMEAAALQVMNQKKD